MNASSSLYEIIHSFRKNPKPCTAYMFITIVLEKYDNKEIKESDYKLLLSEIEDFTFLNRNNRLVWCA